jgi:hypothetical protein
MTEPWTEDEIAAYVDDELQGAERDRIARLIARDQAAREIAERFRATNALLRDAFAAPLSEPTPGDMAALFDESGVVTPLRPQRAPRAVWRPAALAASIALVVGSVGGALVSQQFGGRSVEGAALSVGPAPEALSTALDIAPTGALDGGVRPIASFALKDGGHCREFEVQETAATAPVAFGLACGVAGAWRVVVAADIGEAAAGAPGGFAPAAGAAPDAAIPVLDAFGAGPALDADSERRAIAEGWR